MRQRSLAGEGARLAWLIVLGTVPAAVLGFFLDDFFERLFARPVMAAAFLLVTAIFLVASELLGRASRAVNEMNWKDALAIGLAQALAIVPGISRSGATISAGLARGLGRDAAARYSFMLGTPIVVAAGLFKLVDLVQEGSMLAQAPALAVGFLAAGLVGLGCIHFLLQYLRRRRLFPFAIYCAAVGILCLIVAVIRGAGV
jgi:undecaprenyl-diphosphatase